MNRLASVIRWGMTLFLLFYAACYLLLPIFYAISLFEPDFTGDPVLDGISLVEAMMLLGVSIAFVFSGIALIRSRALALPAYVIGLALDIAVNMIVEMRVELAEPLTAYEIARDILIMGGILVAMIWLRYTGRFDERRSSRKAPRSNS